MRKQPTSDQFSPNRSGLAASCRAESPVPEDNGLKAKDRKATGARGGVSPNVTLQRHTDAR